MMHIHATYTTKNLMLCREVNLYYISQVYKVVNLTRDSIIRVRLSLTISNEYFG